VRDIIDTRQEHGGSRDRRPTPSREPEPFPNILRAGQDETFENLW